MVICPLWPFLLLLLSLLLLSLLLLLLLLMACIWFNTSNFPILICLNPTYIDSRFPWTIANHHCWTFGKLDVCLHLNIHMVTPSWWMLCWARAAIQGLLQSVLMVKSIILLHTMAITAAHRHLKHDDSQIGLDRVRNANGWCSWYYHPRACPTLARINSPQLLHI